MKRHSRSLIIREMQIKSTVRYCLTSVRMCYAVLSCSVVSDSLGRQGHARDCRLPASTIHGDSPGQNTGVGCHALLQGIFLTQGSNSRLPHWGQIIYNLNHQRSPLLEWLLSKKTRMSGLLFSISSTMFLIVEGMGRRESAQRQDGHVER